MANDLESPEAARAAFLQELRALADFGHAATETIENSFHSMASDSDRRRGRGEPLEGDSPEEDIRKMYSFNTHYSTYQYNALRAAAEVIDVLLPPKTPEDRAELTALFSPRAAHMGQMRAYVDILRTYFPDNKDTADTLEQRLDALALAHQKLSPADKREAKKYGDCYAWHFDDWRIARFGEGKWKLHSYKGRKRTCANWYGDLEIVCPVSHLDTLLGHGNYWGRLCLSSQAAINVEVRDGKDRYRFCVKPRGTEWSETSVQEWIEKDLPLSKEEDYLPRIRALLPQWVKEHPAQPIEFHASRGK